ncbi:hypothetical protein BLNAU_9730 [Blattamonas nauphoetae]|uniref:DDE-1 domain-containing protein n=1 Tax=Blattamonas nauphoetae TaxID=2049346 RepID=A0ABQ9XV28_9EUKA|nr:hypothetical protein BLNAU_9730 [Blattamonas nauphoetae]
MLPPNTTHITQPLNQTVYKKLEGNLRSKYHPPDPVTSAAHRAEIARILPGSLASCLNPDSIQESFEITGIYPLKSGEKTSVKIRQSTLLTENTTPVNQDIPPPISQPKSRKTVIADSFRPRQ